MQTIFFYSYKGGVGKSLAAANLVVCLSRMGRPCALVDFDLDAPSQHTKVWAGEPALGRGGFVRLLETGVMKVQIEMDNETQAARARAAGPVDWAHDTLDKVAFKPPSNIEDFGQVLDDVREQQLKEDAPEQGFGKIWFLPAGNVQSARYWEVVWGGLWRDIFTVANRFKNSAAEREELRKVLDYLRAVKTSIAALPNKPEYLIVDCRSGSSDLTGTLISAWADQPDDRLVYLFGFNQDSILYLNRLVRDQTSSLRQKLQLVISRIPAGMDFKGELGIKKVLDVLGQDWDSIAVLHSDRDLEGSERLRLGLHASPEPRLLTKEYLNLFERLIPKEKWTNDQSLAHSIGIAAALEDVKQERVFELLPQSGALINKDNTRNVAMKVETFQLLLSGLKDQLEKMAGDRHGALTETVLASAGTRCGRAFGRALFDYYRNEKKAGPQEKISQWCEFDSDVGFGRFELDQDTVTIRGGKLVECVVLLHQSFLSPLVKQPDSQIAEPNHDYCPLMTGYITGVIEHLLNVNPDDLKVTHLPSDLEFGEKSGSCKFRVEIGPGVGKKGETNGL